MKHAAIVVGCVLGLGCIFLGWRELRHREAYGNWVQREAALRESVAELQSARDGLSAELETSERLCSEIGIEVASLRDRTTNLMAQRDHLRAENGRQASRASEKDAALEKARTDLESVRHELLELSAEPHRLQAEVNRRQARIEQLEEALDTQAGLGSVQPVLQAVEGISSDGSVMAISNAADLSLELPCPVRICRRNEILADAWINRMEGGTWIAHVEEWRVPASALVKGEKVFILRVNYHDPDP